MAIKGRAADRDGARRRAVLVAPRKQVGPVMTRFSRNGQDGVALCPTVKRLLKFLGADLTTEIALRLAQSSHDLTSLALQLDRGESDVCHTLKKMQRFGMVNF